MKKIAPIRLAYNTVPGDVIVIRAESITPRRQNTSQNTFLPRDAL